jgi:hypothetical protein
LGSFLVQGRRILEHFHQSCSDEGKRKDSGLFGFWLRFGSVTGFIKPAPSPKPRQKPKILAAHRHIFSVNKFCRRRFHKFFAPLIFSAGKFSLCAMTACAVFLGTQMRPPLIPGCRGVDFWGAIQQNGARESGRLDFL